jgi:hypothetical protein
MQIFHGNWLKWNALRQYGVETVAMVYVNIMIWLKFY